VDELEKDKAALSWFLAAWDDYLNGLPLLLPVILALSLLSAGSFYIIHRTHSFLYALPYMFFVVTPFTLGANLVYIKLVRGGARLADLFSAFPVYHRGLAVSLLLGAATAAGTLLLIVPGIIVYLTYAFSEYAVVDRRTGVKESFEFSAAITQGWKTRVFPVFLLAALVNFMVPDIFVVTGPMKNPSASLDLKPWTIAAAALKSLVFLPWLSLALARAYNCLIAPAPAPSPEPADD
jgi:hypothetical protein